MVIAGTPAATGVRMNSMSLPPPSPFTEGAPRVLLVEDDPLLSRSLARLLRAAGAIVTDASNGQIAQNMLKVRSFDVVLTDLTMPEVGGLEVAAYVRDQDPNLPVILMTAAPTVDTAIRAMELGAMRYLVKPTPPDMLLTSITDATRLARQRRATTIAAARAETTTADEPLGERFDRALAMLWMAHQPIFTTEGVLFGHEALVRSDETSLGSPPLLLGAADRLHRVHDLSRRIRVAVAESLAGTPEHLKTFVNLHPLDLLDDDLYAEDSVLAPHAHRVVLEITERAALDELADAEARVGLLRKRGYKVAVDDLGAGYAGLATLARVAPDVVKLDMSLIRNLDRDLVKQKLVRMVTAVSHDLGALVVSEGIETVGERAMAVELGCDLLQGYLLGRPARARGLTSARSTAASSA